MNVRNTRKPQRRVEVRDWTRLGIQAYGDDNLYPQHIAGIVAASGTATLCLNRYAKYVEGDGFRNIAISEEVVGREGLTLDGFLHAIVHDLCEFGGFAVHVNYNALGMVAEVNPVPFEQCRKGEEDDRGHVSEICTHPDWSGHMTRRGRPVRVEAGNIRRWPVFDPRPEVVQAQMEAVGGIDKYHGQILYVSLDNNSYPVPLYDSCVTEISTDEGLGNIKYRNVRNNFLTAGMLVVKRGAPDTGEHGEGGEDGGIRIEDLEQFQGDTRTGQLLLIEVEDMEDAPHVESFKAHNFDKEFTATDTSTVERIYAQFHQEAFYALRTGRTGFSTENNRSAHEAYVGEVTYEQRFIERVLDRLFKTWHDGVQRDFSIAPLRYITIGE